MDKSAPEKPSVARARVSKSAGAKLLGVSGGQKVNEGVAHDMMRQCAFGMKRLRIIRSKGTLETGDENINQSCSKTALVPQPHSTCQCPRDQIAPCLGTECVHGTAATWRAAIYVQEQARCNARAGAGALPCTCRSKFSLERQAMECISFFRTVA
jgi:hypothetical protein